MSTKKSEFCFCSEDFTHQVGGVTHQIAAKVDRYSRGMLVLLVLLSLKTSESTTLALSMDIMFNIW